MAKPRKQKGDGHHDNYSGGLVLHQKLCVSIDMEEQRIDGHTELKIAVTEDSYVALHADNMSIVRVLVDGEMADFEFIPHYQGLDDEEKWNTVSSAESAADAACSTYVSCLDVEAVPNLLIACPKPNESVDDKQAQHIESKEFVISESSDKEQPANGTHNTPAEKKIKLVCIDYRIEKSDTIIPFGNNMLLFDNQICRACCWFPCMNSAFQRCLFDMEFTVNSKFVVVSNGNLLYQVISKDNPPRKTYVYQLKIPVNPEWILLAVAPFEILPDSHIDIITHMCLSPNLPKLKNTIGFFNNAFSYYEEYLSMSFPFGSYKQIFVPSEMLSSPVILGASISIFNTKLIYDEKIIDETINTRIKLAHALARQWFGIYITADEANDEWLLDGLAGFLVESFVRHFLGNNEARYRRYKANCAVCKADASGATVLMSSSSDNLYSLQSIGAYGKIRSWKSIAILQMLEKQMGPDPFRKILRNIVQKSIDPVNSGRTLSTKEFRHLANKIGNLERPFLKEFFLRWVESYGCPVLRAGFSYNKRRNIIELAVMQCSTPHDLSSGSVETEIKEVNNGWPGMMSIRVHELDGMYDHPVLPMSGDTWQLVEIQCHSKLAAKRVQKPKKGSRPDGSDENVEAASVLDMRNGMDSPLLWIRVDPEMEYLAEIHFHQPLQMWINQLEKDKDVVAQAEAIASMQKLPQLPISVVNALNNLLNDPKAFWRVRIEAAYALAHTASEDADMAGLHNLIKFYKSQRYDADFGLLRPNDFSNVPEYFVIEAIPSAVAMVRTTEGKSPREAIEFILQLLKYNDNNGNHYSDVYWLSALIQSVGELEYCQQSIFLLLSLLKRIERLLQFDSLMPSYNQILTRSCIQTLAKIGLKFSAYVPFDHVCELIKPFRDSWSNPWEVRIEVARALLDLEFYCKGLDSAVTLFVSFLGDEFSLRGQVKLATHLMRLCQEHVESQLKSSIACPSFIKILKLLTSRKAFKNVFLRHHLFCILQIMARRVPSLHAISKSQSHSVTLPKVFSDQFKASLAKLRITTKLQDSFFDGANSFEEVAKEVDTISICSDRSTGMKIRIIRPQEPKNDTSLPAPSSEPPPKEPDIVSTPTEHEQLVSVLLQSPLRRDIPDSHDVLRTSGTFKEADTVSISSAKRINVIKIKVKQRSSSNSRGDEANKERSQDAHNEVDLGTCSSLSVDAPARGTGSHHGPCGTTNQNGEEVNSSHDRESRMSASIGSAKLAFNVDEDGKDLQCTAASRETSFLGANSCAGGGVGGNGGPAVANDDREGTGKKHKKKKDKGKKRKHEGLEDSEYAEYKRRKKEKKRMEKEEAKKKEETRPPSSVPLVRLGVSPKVDLNPQLGPEAAVPRIAVPQNDLTQRNTTSKLRIKIRSRDVGNNT